MLAKSIFYAQQTKRIENHCINVQVEMTLETEFTTADFVISLNLVIVLEVFFKKEWEFFCLCKMFPTQTINLAICLGIYVGIRLMPKQIARVETSNR